MCFEARIDHPNADRHIAPRKAAHQAYTTRRAAPGWGGPVPGPFRSIRGSPLRRWQRPLDRWRRRPPARQLRNLSDKRLIVFTPIENHLVPHVDRHFIPPACPLPPVIAHSPSHPETCPTGGCIPESGAGTAGWLSACAPLVDTARRRAGEGVNLVFAEFLHLGLLAEQYAER